MISIRERIIREVQSRVASAVSPVAVLRQPVIAILREASPALVLTVESDNQVRVANDRVERELVLRITALSRHEYDGWTEADDLICRAHVALLSDQTLGGLCLRVAEAEADWQTADADLDATAIPAVYRIAYRTLVSDITQGG